MTFEHHDTERGIVVQSGDFWQPKQAGQCGQNHCYACIVTNLGIVYGSKITPEQAEDSVTTPQGTYYRYWESDSFYRCDTAEKKGGGK